MKTVVITGASAGVGRAAASAFAKRGYRVGLISRNQKRLQQAQDEISQAGGTAAWAVADVCDHERMSEAAQRLEQALGAPDVWVNNAMATVFAPFIQITAEEFKRATEVTYLGAVYGTQEALKRMYPRNCGVIVQVGSALAYRAIPLQAPYCGAKHAMRGFTDSIRSEILHDKKNIHLCMVQLPALNTPQFSWGLAKLSKHPQPVPPIFQPEVAANAIVWAAEHRRREIIVGGSSLQAIIGNKFLPGYLDKKLASKAYAGQLSQLDMNPSRPNNLFSTVNGDFGAHGIFDERARNFSKQWWFSKNRDLLIGFFILLIVFLALMVFMSGQIAVVPNFV